MTTTPVAPDAPDAPGRAGSSLLRTALSLDAVVTGLNGSAYLAGAAVLDDLLGLDRALLTGVGAFLLGFGAAVGRLATRPVVRPAAVWAVIAMNVLWTAGSLLAAVSGWGSPSPAGSVWIVLQALVVAAFAALQRAGLREVPARGLGA